VPVFEEVGADGIRYHAGRPGPSAGGLRVPVVRRGRAANVTRGRHVRRYKSANAASNNVPRARPSQMLPPECANGSCGRLWGMNRIKAPGEPV
jgi:hypothetical protein